MNPIHASVIKIEIQSNSYVQKPYPYELQGLCYHLAGSNYKHEKHLPPKFHPYLAEWKSNSKFGTKATLKISSISEELTDGILRSLELTEVIRIGQKELPLVGFTVEKQELVSLEVEHSKPAPDEFKINFQTPTKFRTRASNSYSTRAYPDLKLFLRSAARNLHIQFGLKISLEEQDQLVEQIRLVNAIAYPVKVKCERKEPIQDSFIGEVHLDCRNLDMQQKKLLGLLMKSVKYTGVGHKKGYGLGHIQIKRPC